MCHIRYMYACTCEIDSFVCMCVVHMYMNTCSYVRMCELGERMCELGEVLLKVRQEGGHIATSKIQPITHTYMYIQYVYRMCMYRVHGVCVCIPQDIVTVTVIVDVNHYKATCESHTCMHEHLKCGTSVTLWTQSMVISIVRWTDLSHYKMCFNELGEDGWFVEFKGYMWHCRKRCEGEK